MLANRVLFRAATPLPAQARMMATTKAGERKIWFGPFEVTEQVFLTTQHSFGLVNLKPLNPGHVLICPLKPHRRLTDLSAGETADLFATVQLAQRMLARIYFKHSADTGSISGNLANGRDDGANDDAAAISRGGSFNVAVQDGPEAGQTVPHVHVHVIPRLKDDMGGPGSSMDDIYVKMASEEGNVGGSLWDRAARRPVPGGGMPRIEDADRPARTAEQMNAEAEMYRATLREMQLVDE